MRELAVVLVMACAMAGTLPALPAEAQPTGVGVEVEDRVTILRDAGLLGNIQVALDLSRLVASADTVLIGRNDIFADSLASALLQTDAPLLLVPPQGPVPEGVLERLADIGARRVIILGGEQAVSAAVASELSAYEVERRFGASRLETAVDIARRDAPAANSAVLVRAFRPATSTDPTQEFADALAVGGMAARQGLPVLLTETDRLSDATRAYLEQSAINEVMIVGGTAAIAEPVATELRDMGITVERIAGDDRFETAVGIAKADTDAGDITGVTLVEGQGADAWAGGFAAAHYSARSGVPVVLASGTDIPAATSAFLDETVAAGGAVFVPESDQPVLLCVAGPAVCEQGGQALALPRAATVTFDPPAGSTVTTGQRVAVTIAAEDPVTAAFANGTCIESQSRNVTPVDGVATVLLDRPLPDGPCSFFVTFELPNRAIQRVELTYVGSGEAPVATAPPTSITIGYTGPAQLGVGSLIEVTYDQPVDPDDGDTVLIGDLAGDEVRLTCGTNASCAAGGTGSAAEGLTVTVEVTGTPTVTQPRDDGRVNTGGAVVIIGSTLGNAEGTWNVAASGLPGAERVFGQTDPTNAVLPAPMPEADVSASAQTDQVVGSDADCNPLAQFHTMLVFGEDGVGLGAADVGREAAACAARVTSTRNLDDGEEVLVLYRTAGAFVPSRTVSHEVGTRSTGAAPPTSNAIPVSTDIDLSLDADGILGPDDRITVTFTDTVLAPMGSGIRLSDHQGDEATVQCGTHATCVVAGTTLTLTLTAPPELVFSRGDGIVQLGTFVVVLDTSLGNAMGNWNVPASGLPTGERVFGTTDPTNAVLSIATPPGDVTVDVGADRVTVVDAGCTAIAEFDTTRLYNAAGNELAAADVTREGSNCIATLNAAAPLSAGQTLYLVTRGMQFVPNRSTQVTVPG